MNSEEKCCQRYFLPDHKACVHEFNEGALGRFDDDQWRILLVTVTIRASIERVAPKYFVQATHIADSMELTFFFMVRFSRDLGAAAVVRSLA
jgi:hypothetical protein